MKSKPPTDLPLSAALILWFAAAALLWFLPFGAMYGLCGLTFMFGYIAALFVAGGLCWLLR